MNTINFNLALTELRSRRTSQLIRSVAVRIWPFSLLVRKRYSRQLGEVRWNKVNHVAQDLLAKHPPSLSTEQTSALDDLRNFGVHRTDARRFFGENFHFEQLQKDIASLLQDEAVQQQIERRYSNQGSKWYVVRVFGLKPKTAVPASLANLLLSDQVVDTANAYLGLFSRLIYLDVWHNLPRGPSEPAISSEFWHRDHEDVRLFKLFLYLTDVDSLSGPLEYMPGSQPGGEYGSLFPSLSPRGSYPSERELTNSIHQGNARRCTGPAGTLVLYDSSGFHRGGKALENARQVIVATFASDASVDFAFYRLAEGQQHARLSDAAKYAIRAPQTF